MPKSFYIVVLLIVAGSFALAFFEHDTMPFWMIAGLVTGGLTLLLLLATDVYHQCSSFKALPEVRPSFSVSEKYTFALQLHDAVLQDGSDMTAITRSLVSFGFRIEETSPNYISFTRGSLWNDIFAIRVQRQQLYFKISLPLSRECTATLRTRSANISSGELWEFAHQLKAHVEAGAIKCPTCEYNLRGNTTGTCPECGDAAAKVGG